MLLLVLCLLGIAAAAVLLNAPDFPWAHCPQRPWSAAVQGSVSRITSFEWLTGEGDLKKERQGCRKASAVAIYSLLSFTGAVLVGAMSPIQAAVNALVAEPYGGELLASTLCQALELVLLIPISFLFFTSRSTAASAKYGDSEPALWMFGGGPLGGFYVLSLTMLRTLVGVEVMFASVNLGQLLAATAMDAAGFAGLPTRPITKWRSLAIFLNILACIVLQIHTSPSESSAASQGGEAHELMQLASFPTDGDVVAKDWSTAMLLKVFYGSGAGTRELGRTATAAAASAMLTSQLGGGGLRGAPRSNTAKTMRPPEQEKMEQAANEKAEAQKAVAAGEEVLARASAEQTAATAAQTRAHQAATDAASALERANEMEASAHSEAEAARAAVEAAVAAENEANEGVDRAFREFDATQKRREKAATVTETEKATIQRAADTAAGRRDDAATAKKAAAEATEARKATGRELEAVVDAAKEHRRTAEATAAKKSAEKAAADKRAAENTSETQRAKTKLEEKRAMAQQKAEEADHAEQEMKEAMYLARAMHSIEKADGESALTWATLGYVLWAMAAGASCTVQTCLNTRLAQHIRGAWRAALMCAVISCAILAIVYLFVRLSSGREMAISALPWELPLWQTLGGGLLGILCAVLPVVLTPVLGVATFYVVVLFGQLLCSTVWQLISASSAGDLYPAMICRCVGAALLSLLGACLCWKESQERRQSSS